MPNMSYCRFANTNSDLDDCADAAERIINGEEEGLQREELKAAESLIETSINMLSNLLEAAGLDWDDIQNTDTPKRLAKTLAK